MNKMVYIGLLVLEADKIILYEFCFDHLKRKYREKAKLCNMDTNNFIAYIKQKTFLQTLQKLLQRDLKLQIIN